MLRTRMRARKTRKRSRTGVTFTRVCMSVGEFFDMIEIPGKLDDPRRFRGGVWREEEGLRLLRTGGVAGDR